jgi:hypothetical protein
MLVGLDEIILNLGKGASRQYGSDPRTFLSVINYIFSVFYHYLSFMSSKISFVFFLISLGFIGYKRFIKREKIHFYIYLLLALILSQILLFAILVPRNYLHRLFSPYMAIYYLVILYPFTMIRNQKFDKYKNISLITISAIMLGSALSSRAIFSKVSIYKELHGHVGNHISEQAKILIAPTTFYAIGDGFKLPFYFNQNAVYIKKIKNVYPDYHPKNLENFCRSENIRLIYIANTKFDTRILHDPKKIPTTNKILHSSYGINVSDYSIEKEKALLKEFISTKNGKLVYQGNLGEVYKID